MAKQKDFHERVIRKLRRDAKLVWTGESIADMRAILEGSAAERIREEHPIIGEGFVASLQQEAMLRHYDEMFRRDTGRHLDEPYVYPGLMAAWETAPVTVDIDPRAFERTIDMDIAFDQVSAEDVRSLFPACLMFDVRPYNLDIYGVGVDALFAYPSYDDERGYEVLLALAVNLGEGLDMPFESKLVMKGSDLAGMLDSSIEEREWMRGRCLAGIDSGLHDEIFSPFEDEERVLLLLTLLLLLLLWDGTDIEASSRRGIAHWRVSLSADAEGAEAQGEPEAEPDLGDEAEAVEADADVGREPAPKAPGPEEPEDAAPADSEPAQVLEEDGAADSDAGETLRLRDLLSAQEAKSATLEYHLKQARAAAEDARADAAGIRARASVLETMDLPRTPAESLALAERAFPDRLVFLPEARRSAEEFRKGDAAEVWAVLRSVAMVLHPLVFGRGGGSIIHAFQSQTGFELTLREMKMIKQSGQFSRLRTVAYRGEERDASAHVKGKGSKKGETLRVHFFADYDEKKIVVTHCGEHLDTYVTATI